jgi:hypothetical protein
MWDENGEIDTMGEPNAVPVPVTVGAARDDGGMLGMMVQAAQSLVRDQGKLIARAKQVGGLLGKSGFYSFPAGGSTIEGPSIDMAQALVQDWGGVTFQVRILSCENLASGGQRVHLRASVADLKSIVFSEFDQVVTTAPAPGKFAQKIEQRERWNTMQVQSAASKIVRNAILRVLPAWYVDAAFNAALEADSARALNGKTIPEAREAATDALASLGCTLAELESYLGQPRDMWAVPQLSTLRELFAALKSGAVSLEAWRCDLSAKAPVASGQRSALGLPARMNAQPVSIPSEPEREPAPIDYANGEGEPPPAAKRTAKG